MEQGEIFNEVASAIRSSATMAGPITWETSILRDLSLDSVAVMDLIMTLETRFDTVIPMNRMTEIETVGDLVSILALGAPAAAASPAV
jgi:acyl carrier protein